MLQIGKIAGLLLAIALIFAQGNSQALRQPAGLKNSPALELAKPGARTRNAVGVSWHRAPVRADRAWKKLQGELGTDWRASWDDATGVPKQIFGHGVVVPGSVKSPTTAARFANAFLARHIDLLAPGSSPADFVLAANEESDGMRSVGFFQYHEGMRVLHGQLSFRFKKDKLMLIASDALPRVSAPASDAKPLTPDNVAYAHAAKWISRDAATAAQATTLEGPYVLPIIGDARVQSYRTVLRVTVDAQKPVGRWDVYLDAFTGAPVAREQTLRFAQATAKYNAPERRPGGARRDYPARSANISANGSDVTTDATGLFSWGGEQSANVDLRMRGPFVRVLNDAGTDASNTLSAAPGGDVIWNASDDELLDAQLSTFIHGRIVKEYSRTFAPDLSFLNQQLQATVNIADNCNAFSDGEAINFFQADDQCANTGRLSDVVYHEFGHSLHAQSIIQGVGAFDGGFSEGLSDYLAATIQNDPGMGRGFFHTNAPLRDIDPPNSEATWPQDIGEPHLTGLIFAGAMWDLRKSLVETYGDEAGVALANKLFYAAVRRASSIPNTYLEVLAADDDNGDATDGTPNECAINAAFGAHGLRALSAELTPLAVEVPNQAGFEVSVRVVGLATERCNNDGVASASLVWKLRKDSAEAAPIAMNESGGVFSGAIPDQAEGEVVNYKVAITFLDGSVREFPENPAERWLEFFVGQVDELYCTNFDSEDPFANGWTHEMSRGSDDWAWGSPLGAAASGDPAVASSGDNVIGNDLGGDTADGSYRSDTLNFAMSPVVDVMEYSDVRLQYRRWLNVEDSFFDKATIYANGQKVWRNFNSDEGNASATHHQDKQWSFRDVPLSAAITDGTVQVKFEIDSDGGLEMGGWNIDDFCIVAVSGAICGDGEVAGAEQCDEGASNNDTDSDACRTNCRIASCGDGAVDSGEVCDDGNDIDGDECSNTCQRSSAEGEGGGCGCSTDGRNLPPAGGILLLSLVGLALVRRRRS